jgi:hypothetical protein
MRLAFVKPDLLLMVPDYHPDYGLDDTTRAEVLRPVLAGELSPKEAATKHRLHITTVHRWLRAISHKKATTVAGSIKKATTVAGSIKKDH